MFQNKITKISFGIALTFTIIMWVIFLLDYTFHLNWYKYGLYPQTAKGLIGIITAPFLHSTKDFSHIFNNSVPFFILTWMLFYHYRLVAMRVFIFIYFFTGIMMWFLARETYHIGMSGVIYGLTSFLIFSGFFRKNMKVAAISLVVIFLYGSTVWGIFPNQVGVSWEAHAYGFLSGALIAFYYRKRGPQPKKMHYEIEEEMGIEPEEEYWKTDHTHHHQHPHHKDNKHHNFQINYTIIPKKVEVEKEKKPKSDD